MTLRAFLAVAWAAFVLSSCGSDTSPSADAQPPAGVLPSQQQAPAAQGNNAPTLPAAGSPLPPAPAPPLLAYLDGIDALNQGKWTDAVSAFSRALQTNGDDATFVLARGVAETLAEQFQPGLNDLARARQPGRGREAELWTYAAEAMSGIVSPEHTLGGPPRSFGGPAARPLVSIPGHIVQGRDDYTSAYGTVVAYELGMAYQTLRLPPDLGGKGTPEEVKAPPMRAAMLKAGQWFATKAMRRADLAPAHAARAVALHDAKQYEAALRELDYARNAYPDNADLVYLSANCWLALGRPATARRDYTLALTSKTRFAPAYLGRAAAAARLGDSTRTMADLAIADTLDRSGTARVRSTIEADLAKARVDGDAGRMMAELSTAARNATSPDQLIELAMRTHKASTSKRLRYDEIYQDALRTLEQSITDRPRDADRYVALAKYLVAEADNRGEAVEPRRPTEPFRFQASREKELERAIRISDLALVADSKNAGAFIQKALAFTDLKRYDEAEAEADKALAVSGNNAEALRLYAHFRATRANNMSAEAASLRQERCSDSTREEDRGSYIEKITTTTCYPPSPADVARAQQLEAAAAELRRRARSAMERAVQASRGTLGGYLIEADLKMWDGDLNAAQAAIQQAVKLDPKSLEAQDALVSFYARTGQHDRAEEQQAIERQLIHTTAAPLLRLAWTQAAHTAWQTAGDYLTRAQQLDPVDARIPAYLAVVLDGQGRSAEAAAWWRTAIALDEARVRLDEPTAADSVLTRDPIDFAVSIRARLRLGARLAQQGDSMGAAALFAANGALRPRVAPSEFSRQMYPAMLPDDKPLGGAVVPGPQNASTLLAESALAAGKVLQALGRQDDAARQFQIAASFVPAPGTMVPRIGNGRGDTNFADQATSGSGEALFELAKSFLQAGQVEQAQRYLQAATNAGIPDRLRGEANEFNFALARMMNDRRQQPPAYQDPQQQRYADRQSQQDQMRAQQAYRMMAGRAQVSPELVGTWELVPENSFLPMRRTLTIDANADYAMTVQNGQNSRGKAMLQGGRPPVRGEPPRGALVLIAPDGSSDTIYFEFTTRDTMNVQAQDGTKYLARRR